MKRTIAALIMSLMLTVPALAATWVNKLSQDLSQSIYQLSLVSNEEQVGSCTGFVIDQRTSFMLTASHCTPDAVEVQVTADGSKGVVEFTDPNTDISVVRFKDKFLGQALHPGERAKTGDDVLAVGHLFGWVKPQFIANVVSQSSALLPGEGEYTVMAPGAGPGMSGGPVVDTKGRVVGVVIGGRAPISIIRPVDVIRDKTKKFWQYDR